MNAVILDTGPLGQLANPNATSEAVAIRAWADALVANGRRIVVAEVADYEVRRELVRAGKLRSLSLLDRRGKIHEYLPLATPAMRRAADLWAGARNSGLATAHPHALDGDVILVAQAESLGVPFVIATSNVAHIGRFAPADLWSNIPV